MTKNNFCNHHALMFGSGGHFIFCSDCAGTWFNDNADNSNRDREGNILSGEKRYSPTYIEAVKLEKMGLLETLEIVMTRPS